MADRVSTEISHFADIEESTRAYLHDRLIIAHDQLVLFLSTSQKTN